jgi:universal stress protein F
LFAIAPGDVPGVLSSEARKQLDALAAKAPPNIIERTSVHVGSPWQAICEAARTENADLIVIGSHGYGGLDRVVGTTAAKVVNHADRPVLIFRSVAGA